MDAGWVVIAQQHLSSTHTPCSPSTVHSKHKIMCVLPDALHIDEMNSSPHPAAGSHTNCSLHLKWAKANSIKWEIVVLSYWLYFVHDQIWPPHPCRPTTRSPYILDTKRFFRVGWGAMRLLTFFFCFFWCILFASFSIAFYFARTRPLLLCI